MTDSTVRFHWEEGRAASGFRTGVSLHSHTLYSRESMDFIRSATRNTPWLARGIRKQEAIYRARKGREVNMKRAWWTPPLSPREAWDLETKQIQNSLDLNAMASISDHDNIEAGRQLRIIGQMSAFPISVEWTIPFRETFFHIGVHNLPPENAVETMLALAEFTAAPAESRIPAVLEAAGCAPETLVVFNHPIWDENHIGDENHGRCLRALAEIIRPFIHAIELNGLRPWAENQTAMRLAECLSLPVISGGDRHGFEPNACVNLSNAATLAEFVDEVRRDHRSEILFLTQYREPLKMRILDNMRSILADHPSHSFGWTKWSDRVFYLTDEGIEKSLAELWNGTPPGLVTRFVSLVSLMDFRPVRAAVRLALAEKQQFAARSGPALRDQPRESRLNGAHAR